MYIYACDVGSIKRNNFGWASSHSGSRGSKDIAALVKSVVTDFSSGTKVSMGFECPLFIPCPTRLEDIGSARVGERNRAYTSSPAACATVTGLSELAWILKKIHEECPEARATTRWSEFIEGNSQLFIWEAFISGVDKGADHIEDASLAVRAFEKFLKADDRASLVTCDRPASFAGMLILWAEMSDDVTLLRDPCIVLKA
jgi:hypothetical protein